MERTEIVTRRAQMDFELDRKSMQIWGQEEIDHGDDEIRAKLKDTFRLFEKVTGIEYDVNEQDITIWKDKYVVEKMFYILAENDERDVFLEFLEQLKEKVK